MDNQYDEHPMRSRHYMYNLDKIIITENTIVDAHCATLLFLNVQHSAINAPPYCSHTRTLEWCGDL